MRASRLWALALLGTTFAGCSTAMRPVIGEGRTRDGLGTDPGRTRDGLGTDPYCG